MNKNIWLWVIFSLFFLGTTLKGIPKEFLDLGGDSAQYIILAESLSQGKGLRMANYPQEPLSFYYPPIFSLLLTPIVFFWGRNFYLIHLLIALLGYTSLFFLYRLFKKYTDKGVALLVIWLLMLNWNFIDYCIWFILSDIPYLFFTSFTLLWMSRYLEKPSLLNKEGFWVIFGLILSYFTRYIGLTLFLGIMASLLLNPKEDKVKFKKIIFLASSFLIVFTIWQIFKSLSPIPVVSHLKQLFLIDPYVPQKGSLFANPLYFIIRFIKGANYYHRILGDVFFSSLFRKWYFLSDFLSSLILIIMLLGLWVKFQEYKNGAFHYYFLFYFLLIICWPFREGVRFILPILPFIFFYFFSGLKKILSFLPKRIAYFCFLILFSCLFIFNILSLPMKGYTFENLPQPLKNFVSLHNWVKENLPSEGIIISRKPTVTYFYTNHKAIIYPFSLNPEEIWQETVKNNVKYIIADEFSRETYFYLTPFLNKYTDRLKLLYRIENTAFFEIKG